MRPAAGRTRVRAAPATAAGRRPDGGERGDTHFLLINALSNIMRYSPHGWGSVLANEVNSGTSLLIKKYLSAFENKLPFIVLRDISRYYPYVS
ncbi:YaaC family protein [Polyangium fumosum]|uniref:YaaC family protein n=1 Tax=Polyangium fumosum TaxID=889272 RepID=UPI003B837229